MCATSSVADATPSTTLIRLRSNRLPAAARRLAQDVLCDHERERWPSRSAGRMLGGMPSSARELDVGTNHPARGRPCRCPGRGSKCPRAASASRDVGDRLRALQDVAIERRMLFAPRKDSRPRL